MANILVIDDNETMREGVAQVVERMGHVAYRAVDGVQGLERFQQCSIDFTITDLKMARLDGLGVLREIRREDSRALVLVITAHGTVESAVEAMKAGAFDYITKPFPPEVLRLKVEKALGVRLERERLEEENAYLRRDALGGASFDAIVGDSEAMRRTLDLVRRVAPTDSTVHLFGESGTGKELVAKALHEASGRGQKPFIRVSCSALAESLLESELFGHEKGAFTGAAKRRLGRFEVADGGTLFLDEIADISPGMQVKLLRVLQERAFERVGGTQTVKVDVRIVSATHKDLRLEVEAGRFREDLFYRLHIVPITLPPLRERPRDVVALAHHFIGKLRHRTRSQVKSISAEALLALQSYGWPGNVRELENSIEQSLVFAVGEEIGLGDLPPHLHGRPSGRYLELRGDARPLPDILEDLERQLILRAFRSASGVKTETARILGIKTSALYYKLEKYGIDESLLGES